MKDPKVVFAAIVIILVGLSLVMPGESTPEKARRHEAALLVERTLPAVEPLLEFLLDRRW